MIGCTTATDLACLCAACCGSCGGGVCRGVVLVMVRGAGDGHPYPPSPFLV